MRVEDALTRTRAVVEKNGMYLAVVVALLIRHTKSYRDWQLKGDTSQRSRCHKVCTNLYYVLFRSSMR